MKKIILAVFVLAALFTACRKNNGPAVFDLGVDLQNSYKEDNVLVFIDDQTLFNAQATTDNMYNLAHSISTTNTEGKHIIKVVINGNTVAEERFEQHDNLYIGVNYNKEGGKVSFRYSPTLFTYN